MNERHSFHDLTPDLRRLFEETAAGDPGPLAWAQVQDQIRRSVEADQRRVRRRGFAAFALGAAAAVLLAVLVLDRGDPPASPATAKGDAEALAIADESDVVIESLHGPGWPALPVGDPGPLVLAEAADVRIEGADPDSWPDGSPRMTIAPGDAPMVYALNIDP